MIDTSRFRINRKVRFRDWVDSRMLSGKKRRQKKASEGSDPPPSAQNVTMEIPSIQNLQIDLPSVEKIAVDASVANSNLNTVGSSEKETTIIREYTEERLERILHPEEDKKKTTPWQHDVLSIIDSVLGKDWMIKLISIAAIVLAFFINLHEYNYQLGYYNRGLGVPEHYLTAPSETGLTNYVITVIVLLLLSLAIIWGFASTCKSGTAFVARSICSIVFVECLIFIFSITNIIQIDFYQRIIQVFQLLLTSFLILFTAFFLIFFFLMQWILAKEPSEKEKQKEKYGKKVQGQETDKLLHARFLMIVIICMFFSAFSLYEPVCRGKADSKSIQDLGIAVMPYEYQAQLEQFDLDSEESKDGMLFIENADECERLLTMIRSESSQDVMLPGSLLRFADPPEESPETTEPPIETEAPTIPTEPPQVTTPETIPETVPEILPESESESVILLAVVYEHKDGLLVAPVVIEDDTIMLYTKYHCSIKAENILVNMHHFDATWERYSAK